MENLPLELNTNILTRLPVKTLCQLKCVSKPFNTLITTHHFAKTYLDQTPSKPQLLLSTSTLHTLNIFHNNHQSPPHPLPLQIPSNPFNKRRGKATQLVGSCNGLVCLYHPPNTYSFLNPTTREFRVLPDPGTFPVDARIRLSGFGYVSVCDDYMVVSIGTDNTGAGDSVIRVYSARGDSWKTVLARVPFRVLPWVKPVFVNGVVHWLGFGGKFPPRHIIMGFDFAKEEFKILPLPGNMNERGIKALGVLGGCVCVLSKEHVWDSFLEMWMMMEYGVRESWTRTLSIGGAYNRDGITYIFPICYVEAKVLLLVKNNTLVLYDPVARVTENLDVKSREDTMDVIVYEESIVSPFSYICQDHLDRQHVPRKTKEQVMINI